jgi:hypothetical protein
MQNTTRTNPEQVTAKKERIYSLTRIPERHEHFGFGAKATLHVDLSEVEGKPINIQLVSVGTLQVGSPTPDSRSTTHENATSTLPFVCRFEDATTRKSEQKHSSCHQRGRIR